MRQVGNNVACIAVSLAANLDEALWFYLPPGSSLTLFFNRYALKVPGCGEKTIYLRQNVHCKLSGDSFLSLPCLAFAWVWAMFLFSLCCKQEPVRQYGLQWLANDENLYLHGVRICSGIYSRRRPSLSRTWRIFQQNKGPRVFSDGNLQKQTGNVHESSGRSSSSFRWQQ